MLPEEKPTNRWLIRGLVVGPKLPKNSVKLGQSCRIRRITEGERRAHLQRAARLRADPLAQLRQQFGSVGAFSLILPLTHHTESKHELSITVAAPNPPLAVSKAVEEADEYLTALSLAVYEQRYLFEPTVAKKLPDRNGSYPHEYIPSRIGAASVFYPETLKPHEERYVKALLKLYRENPLGDVRNYVCY